MLKSGSSPHYIESKDRYATSNGRPDINVVHSHSEFTVDLDIALSHPLCKISFPEQFGLMEGSIKKRREEIKHQKNSKQELPGGFSLSVIPIVFEHYGRCREEVEQYLNSLSEHDATKMGETMLHSLQLSGANIFMFENICIKTDRQTDRQMIVEIRTPTNSSAIGENASRQLYNVAMQRQLLENYPVLLLQELVM